MNLVKINSQIFEILKLIPNNNLVIKNNNDITLKTSNDKELLKFTSSDLIVSGFSAIQNLFRNPNPLTDNFVPLSEIQNLFNYLIQNHLFQRLNHLGICYQVNSITKEKERLIDIVKKNNLHLYEETSPNESKWFYIGDTTNWQDSLVEVVLVEGTQDKWKDYWLPHFQIDIDTYLEGKEIETMINNFFKGKVKPYRMIEINNFIVLVRARLGIISGININLDFGSEGRMTRHHRTKLLKKLT